MTTIWREYSDVSGLPARQDEVQTATSSSGGPMDRCGRDDVSISSSSRPVAAGGALLIPAFDDARQCCAVTNSLPPLSRLGGGLDQEFVDVAPSPILARLEALDDGVA
jgi:hypothetical protein